MVGTCASRDSSDMAAVDAPSVAVMRVERLRAGIGKLVFKAYKDGRQAADTGCKRVAFSGQIRGQKRQVRTTTKLQSGYFKFHTPRLADSRREDHNLRLQTRSDFESLGSMLHFPQHTSKLNHETRQFRP